MPPSFRPVFPNTDRLLVACSGGPDSMALLDWADAWRRETGASRFVAVAHIHHGLRPGADGDARFVKEVCEKRGLPCFVVKAPVPLLAQVRRKGIEEAARFARYTALARLAKKNRCANVATGHNLSDQVETVFMNLLRGAGPSGLTGMAAEGPWPLPTPGPLSLVRPLLNLRRADILSHLKKRRMPWRNDPTNAQPLFLRNRLRPVLAEWDRERPGLFERIAQTALILRDEDSHWKSRFPPQDRRKRGGLFLDLPRFLRYSVVEQRRCLRHAFGLTPFESVERVRRLAETPGTHGPLDLPGVTVSKKGRRLVFDFKVDRPGTSRQAKRK